MKQESCVVDDAGIIYMVGKSSCGDTSQRKDTSVGADIVGWYSNKKGAGESQRSRK